MIVSSLTQIPPPLAPSCVPCAASNSKCFRLNGKLSCARCTQEHIRCPFDREKIKDKTGELRKRSREAKEQQQQQTREDKPTVKKRKTAAAAATTMVTNTNADTGTTTSPMIMSTITPVPALMPPVMTIGLGQTV
jgi:uncharacterized Zn finger protein (UPF0148 family)